MIALLSLSLLSISQAAEDDWEFSLEGYYRFRGYAFHNLYTDQEGPGRYMNQRLRIQPMINFEDRAKFIMMADVMDDAIWGDNQSIASTSLFAGDPSLTQIDGQQGSSFQIKRAWLETNLAVGTLKAGRQESHWGLGLLANSGNGFDDAFGENHGGATFDRVLFATKPLAVSKALFGIGSDIPFYMGYAFDRLVEDPLTQYYGYECEKGIGPEEPEYNVDCYDESYDVAGNGLTNLEHGYTDDSRLDSSRNSDWAFDNADDVTEHVGLMIYKGQNVPMFGSLGDFTLGAYGIYRGQEETESTVYIWDVYTSILFNKMYVEGEILNIRGTSRAIVLPGSINEQGDPLLKDVDIWAYVARLGYKASNLTAYFETGYAGGDDALADSDFTGRAIHADYNVGLLLYDQVLAIASANTLGESAEALSSKGGVYNSRYINPIIRFSPIENWEVIGGYVHVWPDRPDGAVIQCTEDDLADADLACGSTPSDKANATENAIGWEVDLALKARLHKHILFSVETGYAEATDRIKLENVGLNPEGKFYTLQTRMAYEF
jgi:hypothetical protein